MYSYKIVTALYWGSLLRRSQRGHVGDRLRHVAWKNPLHAAVGAGVSRRCGAAADGAPGHCCAICVWNE